jgi:hypothetical protein
MDNITMIIIGIVAMLFIVELIWVVGKWLYEKIYTLMYGPRINTNTTRYDPHRWEKFQ